MRKFMVGVTLLSLLLSGCGKTIAGNDGGTATVTHMPASNSGVETGTYALGIVWKHHIYDANENGISSVGKQLGRVKQVEKRRLNQNDGGTVSNTDQFPVGSKIYQVPGKNVSQFIAVQEGGGKYVQIEADPHK